MSRHEWVRERLDNWANWLDRGERGAQGYPRQTAFAKWMPHGGVDGSHVPVSDVQARATDTAVNALRFTNAKLYLVVHLRWVGDPRLPAGQRGGPRGVEATAEAMCLAVSTVYALQAQALDVLAMALPRY